MISLPISGICPFPNKAQFFSDDNQDMDRLMGRGGTDFPTVPKGFDSSTALVELGHRSYLVVYRACREWALKIFSGRPRRRP